MYDATIAGVLVTLLITLAVAAQIWGHDSRDRIDSVEWARRQVWHQRRYVALRLERSASGRARSADGA